MRVQPDNIPADALTVLYKVGKREAIYHFWHRWMREEESWYWSALGNCGIEDTVEEAQEAARKWIREH